jgi:hypothetical protein
MTTEKRPQYTEHDLARTCTVYQLRDAVTFHGGTGTEDGE